MSKRHPKNLNKGGAKALAAKQELENEPKVEVPPIPKLKPFVRETFFGFSIQALLIDLLFIAFSFLISDEFFSNEGLFDKLKTWQILAMYCAVVCMMPYHLGYVYVRNSAYFSKPAMKVQLWIFILITAMTLVNLIRLVIGIDDIENIKNDVTGFFAVFSMFMLVLGPMMSIGGAMQARDEFSNSKEDFEKFNSDSFGTMGAFMIMILAIAFMVYFIGLFPQEHSGWAAVAGMFLGPLAAVIVMAFYMGFLTLLSKIGVYKYLRLFSINAFPFLIIAVLVFWSGVTIHFMYSDFGNAHGKVPLLAVIFSVVISGLLPFRLIMMFKPPWQLSNMIIGFATLAWFLYSIVKNLA